VSGAFEAALKAAQPLGKLRQSLRQSAEAPDCKQS
jgi:hypothetical protein